jgi:UDP-glucose 4-epimerase
VSIRPREPTGRTVLVTGGAGAIGGHLVRELAMLGNRVVVLDDLSSGRAANVPQVAEVELQVGSILDAGLVEDLLSRERVDDIFHLAALFANQNSVEHPEEDLITNALGTVRMLECARRFNVKRFLYASSSCIYGDGESRSAAVARMDTPYAISKMSGEAYVHYYCRRQGVPATILRYFNSFGPHDLPGPYRSVIPNFLACAIAGLPLVITGSGRETRDFTYVADIVAGTLLAAASDRAIGQVFDIGSGEETDIATLAESINRIAQNAAGLQYRDRRSWDGIGRRRANLESSRRVLGYAPSVTVEEGLRRTHAWMLEELAPVAIAARPRLRAVGNGRRRASPYARMDARGARPGCNSRRRANRVTTSTGAAIDCAAAPDVRPQRRVLMICFAYPPVGGAGMIRSAKFVKFLPQFGYEPIVVTPVQGAARLRCDADFGRSPGATIHRTGYRDVVKDLRDLLRRRPQASAARRPAQAGNDGKDGQAGSWRQSIRRLAYEAVTMPDEHIGWKRPAVDALRALMAREPIDAVYSTSPPESAHLVARTIKREFGLPWIADLRDLWSDDHYRQRSHAKRWVLRRIEHRTLADADVLVTVSEPWRRQLAASYETNERRVLCVPHGFDADDYRTPAVRSDGFTITYTGTLDRRFQDPEPFFAALGDAVRRRHLDRDHVRVNFHVFGDNIPDLDGLAARYGLAGVAARCAPLEYRSCLAVQQGSTALLAIQWRSEAALGNPPLKVYDYLGARRPILVVGTGDHVLGPLLEETGAGLVARSPAETARILADWYTEFRMTGDVRWHGRDEAVARYTRRAQTAKLAAAFDAAIERATAAVPVTT